MLAVLDRRTALTWSAVMVLFCLTTAVESLSWTQLGAFTPLYLRELGVPAASVPAWTAASSSLGWVIALPLAPFWGVLADRYSRKAVIVRSAVFEAVIFAGWAFAPDPWTALGFRLLNGLVLGNTGVMLAVQADMTPKERIGLAVGVITAGPLVGRSLGPALGAVLINHVDVRGMLLVDAIASAAIALLLVLVMPEPHRVRNRTESVLRQLREAVGEITGNPLIWRMFAAVTVTQVGMWAVLPYLPIYVGRLAESGPVTNIALAIGLASSAMGLAGAVAAPLWGRLMDRRGHVPVLMLTTLLTAATLTVAGFATSYVSLVAPLVLYSLSAAAIQTAIMALLARHVSPARRGAVLGQVLFPFYLGGLAGPVLGSLVFGFGQPWLFGLGALLTLGPLVFLGALRGERAVLA